MKQIKRLYSLFILSIFLLLAGCDPILDTSSNYETSSVVTGQSSKSEISNTTTGIIPAKTSTGSTAAAQKKEILRVHFIDVGQGDSIFIELPDGRAMLIDAGEYNYSSKIRYAIEDAKEDTLDFVIATHPHSDHIGGMSEIIKNFKIGAIYMPKVSHTSQTYENLLVAIQKKGLKVNTAKAGVNIINNKNLKINILAPVKDKYNDLNDWSAVLKLTYGSTSFLFMGDATTTSEKEITANVKADVLKVGHHGSRYSTSDSFLAKISPKYAVISVGKENSYNHPTAELLNKLTRENIKVYRTDISGTIVFESDGKKITVNKSPKVGMPATTTSRKTTPTDKPTEMQNTTDTQADPQEVYVYVTKTGSKYHREDCSYLSQSNIKIALTDAKKKYSPCSKCNPPQ